MGKFLAGFVLGAGIGAGLALLLAPEPGHVSREKLRTHTDQYAAGTESPIGTAAQAINKQRSRFAEALEAGRRASAAQQAALWSRLNLNPPEEDGEADETRSE